MTTTVGTKAIAGVVKALNKVGISITYTQFGDPGQAVNGAPSRAETPHTILATPPYQFDSRYQQTEMIEDGDFLMLIKAQTFTPSKGDEVTFGAKTHTLVRYDTISGDERPAAYVLHLR